MKTQTMQNQTMQSWRCTSVVPTYGFVMGDVRPQAVDLFTETSALKRHAAAIKAVPATGPLPWSPPVT